MPHTNSTNLRPNCCRWNQSSGALLLQIPGAGALVTLEARTLYTFSFNLKNPSVGQAAAVVTIFGSLYGSTGAFNDGVNAALAAPLLMDRASYLSAPLAVTDFDVKFIQQQTTL